MIQNAAAFRLDEPPRAVVGRNSEQQQLARRLEPLVTNEPGQSAVLDGPAGAGKTTVAQSTLDRLREQSRTVNTAFVHCSGMTRYTVLQRIGRETGVGPSGHARSAADLLERLRDLPERWVVVLDEVDAISDRSVLTDLFDISYLTVVCITNDIERLRAGLEDRGRSRLNAHRTIHFDAYTDQELVAILRDRADWGLPAGVVTDARLEQIARAANGDARNAISILHSAAEVAASAGRHEITASDVEGEAIDRAAAGIRDTQLGKLSRHHRAVHRALDTDGECDLETLYDRYCGYATEPRSKRMMQNYLADLVDYSLVERRGPKQSRTFVAVDPL